MSNDFDLDVTFDEGEPDISSLSNKQLQDSVNQLPAAIRAVAQGLLIEKRKMSDVSQDLGIRQAELVARLHRAKKIIASSYGL
jgi:DNA-directed RNA polymerase specialized sigma24 family protein